MDPQETAVIIGPFVPLIIAVIARVSWNTTVRQIVSAGVALAIGAVLVLIHADFGIGNIFQTLAAVVGMSQVAYTLLWKPTGVASTIEQNVLPGPKQ